MRPQKPEARTQHSIETLKLRGYNDFIGHTVQPNGTRKCGASEWPHIIELIAGPCYTGGGWHNFAADGVCQDCGIKSAWVFGIEGADSKPIWRRWGRRQAR